MKIRMHVEVFPTIEIKDEYKKISLKKKVVKVAAKEVKAALDDIQKRFTTFQEVDKKSTVAQGDRVTINTQGFDKDGTELDATKMEEYPLVIGSGMLVPGFEDGMVGAKIGDKLDLAVPFPKDYHNKDFAGKDTTFKVEVVKLEKAVKPEFTPEFIKDLRGKELDLDGFKELIKSEILDTKESNTRMEEESELIEALVKITTMEIGDKLLAEQMRKVFEEIKQNMSQDNVKMADYLESLKLDEEGYKEAHVKPVALKRLQGELILNRLSEIEPKRAEVTDDMMKAEIVKIKASFDNPEVLERLESLYVEGSQYYSELQKRLGFRNMIESFYK
jgi:trigger factor